MLAKRIRRHAHLLVPVHDVRRHNQLHHTSKAFSRFPWYSALLPIPMLTPRLQARIQCCQRRLQELQEAWNHFADRLIHHLTFRSDQVRYTKAYRVYIPEESSMSLHIYIACLFIALILRQGSNPGVLAHFWARMTMPGWLDLLFDCLQYVYMNCYQKERTWNNMKLSSLVHLAITLPHLG